MKTPSTVHAVLHRAAGIRPHRLWLALPSLLAVLLLNSCQKEKAEPEKPPVIRVTNVTQNGILGQLVVLDGSGTADPQNQTLIYNWTIKTKPTDSKATITNSNSIVAGFSPDKPGTYVLLLTVTNASNLTSSVEVTITVAIPGRPPVADAGPSGTVPVNNRIRLDGSKSSDPDSDKLTYQWAFKSIPPNSKAVVLNPTQAITEFTADVVGTYVVSLTVSDGNWPVVSADASITAVAPTTRQTTGSWTAADGTGGGNAYTPRNHVYTFDVATNNQPVSLSLASSDINVGLYIYDPNGNEVGRSGFGRSQQADVIVNAGKYTVMVASGERYDIGAYKLVGKGMSSEFTRVPALREKALDVSFGPEGSGGALYTPRNRYYTFDVTADNAFVDINTQSPDVRLQLVLFNSAGARVDVTNYGTPAYLINKLNKGTYGLWVLSATRDIVTKYSLDIFGQVQNLKQFVNESSVLADEYRGKAGATTYTLNVTENNSILDIALRSPDIAGNLAIFNPNGERIDITNFGNYAYMTPIATAKGQYRIIVTPTGSGIGRYTLSVYGKFTDLKKVP